MNGYDVVTSDNHKLGHVVDEVADCVIVEHGHVFKSRQAIPRTFLCVDDDAQVVQATITKDVFSDSPKVTDGWDCNETLRHYGLVGSFAEPDTEGYGETLPTDPALTADDSAVAERAAFREGTSADDAEPAIHERSHNALDPSGITVNR